MKIILYNGYRYVAIDCKTLNWSEQKITIEEALNDIQTYAFSNTEFTDCTSMEEVLNVLKNYSSYHLIEFISDEPTSYEFW